MSDTTPRMDDPLVGARGQRAWYGLEERHQALFALRAIVASLVAIVAVAAPLDLSSEQRRAIVLVCAGAVLLHAGLHFTADRQPRLLRTSVDVGLIVDAALVGLVATYSGHLDSEALWLIPVFAVGAALGLSVLTGIKALVALGLATAAVAVAGPPDAALSPAIAPLAVAGALVAVSAAMASVNERELRRRGERVDALHDASLAFVTANDSDEMVKIAREAAERLLPGWDVRVVLGVPATEQRTHRTGG